MLCLTVHMDLDLYVEGKEAKLVVMGAFIMRLRVRHVIACGDLNVHRSVRRLSGHPGTTWCSFSCRGREHRNNLSRW